MTLLSGTTFAAHKVLTSIKPLQLIAQAVTKDITTVDVLLPLGASPHSHSMKPSDVRKLHNADIIFWVGPDMEVFMEKMLANTKGVVTVALMQQSSLKLLENDSNHRHEHDHHHENGHQHEGSYDSHIWLSPVNAVAIADTMAQHLAKMDPANVKHYQANLNIFKKSVALADEANKNKLSDVRNKPMFSFHDSYSYLQDHYHLNVVDYFTVSPDQQPGAKHLNRIREDLKRMGKSCIFLEPQFRPAYIDTVIQGTQARVTEIDPLATDIKLGPDGYVHFLNKMVDSIVQCLK